MSMSMPEPHTAGVFLKVFGYIKKAFVFIETWWMRVRITSPRDQGKVAVGNLDIEGTYRTTFGKKIVLFKSTDNDYWYQRNLVIGAGGRWTGKVYISDSTTNQAITIAIISPDIETLITYYDRVKEKSGGYIGIRMTNLLPPGIQVLHRVEVNLK
jgi:hypothetical protein